MLISVIVTAYNRREYLKDAVTSVLRQDIDPNLVEIIIVKNFSDPEIDALSSSSNISIVQAGNETIGRFMELGIQVAKGEVLTFLDDDDIYQPDRLKRIHIVFSSNPKVYYYKNEWSIFEDKTNDNVEASPGAELSMSDIETFDTPFAIKFANRHFRWNMSCIAVRKEVFSGFEEYVPRISAAVDLGVFYMAASKNEEFVHDKMILTSYRRHVHSMSHRKGLENDPFREYNSLIGLQNHISGDLLVEDFQKTLAKLRILSVWEGSSVKRGEIRSLLSSYLRLRFYSLDDIKVLGFIFFVCLAVNLLGSSSIRMLRRMVDPIWTYEKGL